MPSFGSAGTRIVRKNIGAVRLDTKNEEHLFFQLTAEGAEPLFSIGCQHRSLRSERDFQGHPMQKYEWSWGKAAGDMDAHDDMYVVSLSFLSATKYTLRVEQRRAAGSVLQVLKDIEYASQDPSDTFRETLRVFSS